MFGRKYTKTKFLSAFSALPMSEAPSSLTSSFFLNSAKKETKSGDSEGSCILSGILSQLNIVGCLKYFIICAVAIVTQPK